MKRIAYIHREFRLCEWPSEPTTHRWSPDDSDDAEYAEAVTSAMENGVVFSDQEKAKHYVFMNCLKDRGGLSVSHIWQPKEGDNWPAPEETEIEFQSKSKKHLELNAQWWKCTEEEYNDKQLHLDFDFRKVAVLRSESVEKKEKLWDFKSTEEAKQFMRWYFKRYYAMKWEAIEIDLYNEVEAFRNQSTPKE